MTCCPRLLGFAPCHALSSAHAAPLVVIDKRQIRRVFAVTIISCGVVEDTDQRRNLFGIQFFITHRL